MKRRKVKKYGVMLTKKNNGEDKEKLERWTVGKKKKKKIGVH